jgi:hypothetical protein
MATGSVDPVDLELTEAYAFAIMLPGRYVHLSNRVKNHAADWLLTWRVNNVFLIQTRGRAFFRSAFALDG